MNSLSSDFQKQGFAVFHGLLSQGQIDKCLFYLEKIKRRRTLLLYTQSTHRWESPRTDSNGYLVESILNPSQQVQAPRFAHSVSQLIYSHEVYSALRLVFPVFTDFVSWQDMAFDRSTGTVDHIDSWYLDTEQPGGLVGAWLALEDICMESGPFFVCPGSHHLGEITSADAHNHVVFLSCVKQRIEENHLEKVPLLLRKGDLLFWNSLLIHGSFSPHVDSPFSRKSLTAHFYPLGLRRSSAVGDREFRSDLHCLRSTLHPRIHRLARFGRTPSFYAFAGPFLAIKDRLGAISERAWNMRR